MGPTTPATGDAVTDGPACDSTSSSLPQQQPASSSSAMQREPLQTMCERADGAAYGNITASGTVCHVPHCELCTAN